MGAENLVSSCSPMSAHCAGMASVWPIRMRRASNLGLAVINASSLIPYFRATPAGVSPADTVWVFIPAGTELMRVDLTPAEGVAVDPLIGA